jgi:hypothetical protein
MRKKTIAAFAAVYIAICLTCGAVNGINFPNSDDSSAIAVTESTEVQTTTTEQQTQSTNGRKSKRSKTASDETQTDTETSIQTTVPEQTPDESETEKKEDETQIEEQTQASDAPSLEEYLSKLRCGGCGHNCSLVNPRCMRGARKQSSAKSEYSELYG